MPPTRRPSTCRASARVSTTDPAASLDAIICTSQLLERVASRRDIPAEHAALMDLVGQFATESALPLQRLVDLAVELCKAGSAGVSLLEPGSAPGNGLFRWAAMAGEYRGYVGGTTPEGSSPCGTCLALGTPQLYRYPARLFTYLSQATPPIVEGLVIPLRSGAGPLGTIWVVSHVESCRFTAQDVAVMSGLADFTSTALALERSRNDAQAANRAKDEFLAVVSHELRRPLTAILGWSELLLAGRVTPVTAARAIEALHTNARRQLEMVDDLMDASRTLTGALRLNEKPMDLGEVVRSAVEIVAGDAAARGVELVYPIDRALPFLGDPERLHQVIGNLLGNGVKFTPAGGRVVIGIEVAPPWVEISVRDTGVGIAPHVIPMLFDTFRRADASSTGRASGLGLGLTIARRLIELHDGTLEACSDGAGAGALLTARLPSSRLLAGERNPAPLAQSSAENVGLAGLNILVVDDEIDIRDMIAVVLEDAGATVVAVEGVQNALAVLARQPIDVLLSDLAMPGQDGYDLVTMLGQDNSPRRPATLIAVTALAGARERQRALASGFDHHVSKPVDFELLVGLIDRCARPHDPLEQIRHGRNR